MQYNISFSYPSSRSSFFKNHIGKLIDNQPIKNTIYTHSKFFQNLDTKNSFFTFVFIKKTKPMKKTLIKIAYALIRKADQQMLKIAILHNDFDFFNKWVDFKNAIIERIEKL